MQVGRVNPPRRQVNRPNRTETTATQAASHEVQWCALPFRSSPRCLQEGDDVDLAWISCSLRRPRASLFRMRRIDGAPQREEVLQGLGSRGLRFESAVPA
jgi:hypothetical protein